MRTKMLNINEMDVTCHPVIYTCYGLGSCIGLFISDKLKKMSGGAHILLPFSSLTGELMDATHIINTLLSDFTALGSDLSCLRAKVTGGAQLYKSSLNIGEQNASVVIQQLMEKRIFIAASDLGGRLSRTARFNSVTGELQISTSQQKKYCI